MKKNLKFSQIHIRFYCVNFFFFKSTSKTENQDVSITHCGSVCERLRSMQFLKSIKSPNTKSGNYKTYFSKCFLSKLLFVYVSCQFLVIYCYVYECNKFQRISCVLGFPDCKLCKTVLKRNENRTPLYDF